KARDKIRNQRKAEAPPKRLRVLRARRSGAAPVSADGQAIEKPRCCSPGKLKLTLCPLSQPSSQEAVVTQ
ncbi:hypothetical protein P7K49_025601, partial [Saguinus oedipus]